MKTPSHNLCSWVYLHPSQSKNIRKTRSVWVCAESMLGYYCQVSSYFLLQDYASALKYLDLVKVSV